MYEIKRNNKLRLIARLDIKNDYVVKGINFEGLRKIGSPKELALKYYRSGIDEIMYMDVVASLYERNTITKYIKEAAKNIFVPLTVGGGIRSLDDIKDVLNSGADKVAINSAAIKNPDLIKQASEEIGSQSIIISIQAKQIESDKWEAYYDCGREKSGLNVLNWARTSQNLGAGELLITSIDNEGMRKGMDMKLLKKLRKFITIPIIFGGGAGSINDIKKIIPEADAVALASVLHYNNLSIENIRKEIG